MSRVPLLFQSKLSSNCFTKNRDRQFKSVRKRADLPLHIELHGANDVPDHAHTNNFKVDRNSCLKENLSMENRKSTKNCAKRASELNMAMAADAKRSRESLPSEEIDEIYQKSLMVPSGLLWPRPRPISPILG